MRRSSSDASELSKKAMSDVLSPAARSAVMARVRSKGNASTEVRLMKLLRAAKIKGWRRHLPLAGTPDFAFPRERIILFVDGCFWHGCRTCYRKPSSNTSYWENKIARNKQRDRRTTTALKACGWQVLRIWEHSLKKPDAVLRRIRSALARSTLAQCQDAGSFHAEHLH